MRCRSRRAAAWTSSIENRSPMRVDYARPAPALATTCVILCAMHRLGAALLAVVIAVGGCSVVSVDLTPRIKPLEEETKKAAKEFKDMFVKSLGEKKAA